MLIIIVVEVTGSRWRVRSSDAREISAQPTSSQSGSSFRMRA
jgi:hypothetical protein